MVKYGFLNTRTDPLMQLTPTLGELEKEVGRNVIFAKSPVASDKATQEAIINYFEMEHLCAEKNHFIFFLRRALMEAYPVYKDQMDAWEARKAFEWFHDKDFNQETGHEGKVTLSEDTIRDIVRTLSRVFAETLGETVKKFGESEETGKETGVATGSKNADGTTSGSSNGNATATKNTVSEEKTDQATNQSGTSSTDGNTSGTKGITTSETRNGTSEEKTDEATRAWGESDKDGTASGTKDVESGEERNGEHSETTDVTREGKDRQFSFAYPESNYSGGVIPYDLDSNPSVEFISTQGDRVYKEKTNTQVDGTTHDTSNSKSHEATEGTTHEDVSYRDEGTKVTNVSGTTKDTLSGSEDETTSGTSHEGSEYEDTGTQVTQVSGKTGEEDRSIQSESTEGTSHDESSYADSNTKDTTGNKNYKDQADTTRKDDSTTDDEENTSDKIRHSSTENESWIEKLNRKGTNVNQLAQELLEQLPTTDFFKQFATVIGRCFLSVEVLDDFIQEDLLWS